MSDFRSKLGIKELTISQFVDALEKKKILS